MLGLVPVLGVVLAPKLLRHSTSNYVIIFYMLMVRANETKPFNRRTTVKQNLVVECECANSLIQQA